MKCNIHTDFILSPITGILTDVVSASAGVGSGLEVFPLCDYIMQATFLKMTGFQEQKMKCLSWEMATWDFEYRYKLTTKEPLGECSKYEEKQKIYQVLIEQIEAYGLETPYKQIPKRDILQTAKTDIENIFCNTNLQIWAQNDFQTFQTIANSIKEKHFANDGKSLFSYTDLNKKMYDALHKQRNKIAHNIYSHQQNLPTLKTLQGEDYEYSNYFIYFYILVLIDKIFIELYKKYLEVINTASI